MPRLVPDRNSGLFNAVADDGTLIAKGYLNVDIIPDGPGSQIVNGVQFVTLAPEGDENAPASSDAVLKQLTGQTL